MIYGSVCLRSQSFVGLWNGLWEYVWRLFWSDTSPTLCLGQFAGDRIENKEGYRT